MAGCGGGLIGIADATAGGGAAGLGAIGGTAGFAVSTTGASVTTGGTEAGLAITGGAGFSGTCGAGG